MPQPSPFTSYAVFVWSPSQNQWVPWNGGSGAAATTTGKIPLSFTPLALYYYDNTQNQWLPWQGSISGGGGGGSGITQLTGDVHAGPGTGSVTSTVVAVNNGIIPVSAAAVGTNGSGQFISISGLPPTGAAGGDLSGTYPNPTVHQVNGGTVPVSAAIVGTNSSGQLIAATGVGTVTSVGLTMPNGFSVSGSPVTSSGTLAVTGVYQLGTFLSGQPTSSQIVGSWAFLYAWTLPANCTGSIGKCGTNPAATTTYTLNKNGSSCGSVSISTAGAFTFTTTSGAAISFAAGDTLTAVAPSTPDVSLANVQIIFSANR